MAIKILIADDHALLRQGIKRVLNFEDDLEVVGEASEGQEALSRTLVLQPDILLIDLNMPGLNGIEVTKQLVAARVKTRIVALTVHDSDRYVLEMLRSEDTMRDIPVMFLTAKQDRERYLAVKDFKPVGYLLKTIDRAGLLKELRNFFAQQEGPKAADDDLF